jgi:hypothetical protein
MRFNISLLLAIIATSSSSSAAGFSPLALFPKPSSSAAVAKPTIYSTTASNDLFERTVRGGDAEEAASSVVSASSESTPSLTQPLCEAPDLDSIADAPLIADIEMLSNMLADVVKRENPVVYDLYTTFRKLGMDRAANPNDVASMESFEAMKKLAYDISPRDALGVMKTFSIALNLVNAAEVHHRMRAVRETDKKAEQDHVGPLPMVEDSIRGTMEILLETDQVSGRGGVDPEKIFEKLITQKCEIVLTAHPTEVNRKTIIRKCEFCSVDWIESARCFSCDVWLIRIFTSLLSLTLVCVSFSFKLLDRNISELLAYLERPDLHSFERAEALNSLRGIIAAIWGSDEIR